MKNQWTKLIALGLVGVLSFTACSAPPPTTIPPATATQAPSPTQATPASVSQPAAPKNTPPSNPLAATVAGAAERLNAGDLEGYLAYWADDALFYAFGLPTGNEIYAGKDQLRAVFKENIDSHFKEQVEIQKATDEAVTAQTTTWHDFTRQIGVAPLVATEIYVVKNSKITSLTWIATSESLAKLKPALESALPPAPAPTPAAASLAPVSALTITVAGGKCSYPGPMTLRAGMLDVTLDIKDQDKAAYALTLHNLAVEKTLADLMVATLLDTPPSWADMFGATEAGLPGQRNTFSSVVTQGPVYMVCWSKPPDVPIGALGPFEVSK